MRNYSLILLCIFCYFVVFIAVFKQDKTVETITYFPIDKQLSFTKAETSFELCPDKTNKICWKLQSTLQHPLYLRQDIGILFANGKVQAILTKWEQNKNELTLEKELNVPPNSYLQAISYHHGEMHNEDESITSVQKMSAKNTFVLKTTDKNVLLTDQYVAATKDIQEKLLLDTERTLHKVWDRWIAKQEINQDNYELIPLTDLQTYNKKPLLTFTQAETNKIIGQLWEGLYKSYLIPLLEPSNSDKNAYMPIILFSHDKTHLIVLYEQNNEIMSLYQKITLLADEPTITIGSNQPNK